MTNLAPPVALRRPLAIVAATVAAALLAAPASSQAVAAKPAGVKGSSPRLSVAGGHRAPAWRRIRRHQPKTPASVVPTPPALRGGTSGSIGTPAASAPIPPTAPTAPTPSSPTTPTVPTSGAGLLFNGSRVRDFALLQEAPNAITETADPLGSGETVLKVTVNDGDVAPVTPTENPRAQALTPDMIRPGQEFWLSTKFLIPADFPSVPGWMSLVSIYGAPFAGSSPWQVGIDGTELSWDRNPSYNWDTPWKTPLTRGRWTTILLHERFATDGFVEMWVNGAPVTFFGSGSSYNPSHHSPTTHLEMKTVDSSNNGGANAAKIMQYRKAGMFPTATVYFGALKLGETRASVGA